MNNLIVNQRAKVKSLLVNLNNQLNKLQLVFDRLYKEVSPGFCFKNNFSFLFSFHVANREKPTSLHKYFQALDFIIHDSSSNFYSTVIIANASIKNNITSSVLHIISNCRNLSKKVHHIVNVTTTEAELFSIRCSITQAYQIFDLMPTRSLLLLISFIWPNKYLTHQQFFPNPINKSGPKPQGFCNRDLSNTVKFWECSNKSLWPPHVTVDKETEQHMFVPQFPYKNSQNYSKKEECNNIIHIWQMTFQTSDLKDRNFFNLLDKKGLSITLTYMKEGAWLKHFSHLNILYARATRTITNHAAIEECYLQFFPKESFECLCSVFPIEIIFFISIEDTTNTRIPIRSQQLASQLFLFSTLEHLHFNKILGNFLGSLSSFVFIFHSLFLFLFLLVFHVFSPIYVVTKQLPQHILILHVIN